MRVLLLLCSCIALSVAQDFVMEMFENSMNGGVDWINGLIKENLLSEDGTTFNSTIEVYLDKLDPQICPMESDECTPSMNWLFGCNCREEFRELGECKKKPCELFRYFRDNGPDILNKFIDAESFEERYKVVMEHFVNPVSKALCECPGMIGASINCVKKYDGSLFEYIEMDASKFNSFRKNFDWKSLRTILLGFVKGGCGEKDGMDCVTEISRMYTVSGTMMDNSFKGEDVCLSMLRFKDEFTQYLIAYGTSDPEKMSISTMANRIMDAYVNMQKEALCDAGCAGEMSDSFYSCCTKHLFETVSSKSMKKAYRRLFQNLWTMFSPSDDPAPDFSGAFRKYLSIMDLQSFCGARTDVYRLKNQQCDAIDA